MNTEPEEHDEQDSEPVMTAPTKAEKLSSMSYDELAAAARSMFGFELDEIKTLYSTEDRLREFILESQKNRGMIANDAAEEDQLGWELGESSSVLPDEPANEIRALRERDEQRMRQTAALVGGSLAPSTSVAKAVKALAAEPDEEDEPPAPKPKAKVKTKPKAKLKAKPKAKSKTKIVLKRKPKK